MKYNSPLYKWLKTQDKEFFDEVVNNELRGDGAMTIEELRELDNKYNPEGENNE